MECAVCGGVLEYYVSKQRADIYRCRCCGRDCEVPMLPDDEVLEQMAKERGPAQPVEDDYHWV
jgi:hypothetical protein